MKSNPARVRRVEKGLAHLVRWQRQSEDEDEMTDEDKEGVRVIAIALIDIWDGLNMDNRGRETRGR